MALPEAQGASSLFCGRSLSAGSGSSSFSTGLFWGAGSTAPLADQKLGRRGRPPDQRQLSTEEPTRMDPGWPGTKARAPTPGLEAEL